MIMILEKRVEEERGADDVGELEGSKGSNLPLPYIYMSNTQASALQSVAILSGPC